MSVTVIALPEYEYDYMARTPDEQTAIDRAVREVRRIALAWTRGPLPLAEFDPLLRPHYLRDGVWAIDWETRNGRITLSFDDLDPTGCPARIHLRRVGGHEIYAQP
ncbi:MAG: hypothetical protein H7287_05025 [Thermoleophilia bacterium]|nr:hypothetical protein [Thermoleophilia bacterium]